LHPGIEQDIINKQVDATTKNYKVILHNEKANPREMDQIKDNFVYFYVFISLERCLFCLIYYYYYYFIK